MSDSTNAPEPFLHRTAEARRVIRDVALILPLTANAMRQRLTRLEGIADEGAAREVERIIKEASLLAKYGEQLRSE